MRQYRSELQFLRVRDFCRLLNLPASTAYRMIATGQVRAVHLSVSGHPPGVIRIPSSEVDRLLGAESVASDQTGGQGASAAGQKDGSDG